MGQINTENLINNDMGVTWVTIFRLENVDQSRTVCLH